MKSSRVISRCLVALIALSLAPLYGCNAPDEENAAAAQIAQETLPFPDSPMSGMVGETMQESVHRWLEQPSRLPPDALNILV